MPASTASFSFKKHPLIVVCLAFILTACGGGGSGDAIGSAAPTAGAVSISGTAQVGQTLTGNYTYADANNDPQGTSTFRWLRGVTEITGATSITYTLVLADLRSTIRFEVTPEATVAPTTGTAMTSSATAEVIGFGFVSQGGLIWMPVSPVLYNWAQADSFCGGAIAGQSGWRLPTQLELGAFYAAYPGGSFELDSQGWILDYTWSATAAALGWHSGYILSSGSSFGSDDAVPHYVTCVR